MIVNYQLVDSFYGELYLKTAEFRQKQLRAAPSVHAT